MKTVAAAVKKAIATRERMVCNEAPYASTEFGPVPFPDPDVGMRESIPGWGANPVGARAAVETFSSSGLKTRTRHVPCVLNLLNVPREATLTELGMSGTRQLGPAYPARDIVRGEFNEVLSANFRPVAQAEQARIELKVESRRLILVRRVVSPGRTGQIHGNRVGSLRNVQAGAMVVLHVRQVRFATTTCP